jgi:hypothetical protein
VRTSWRRRLLDAGQAVLALARIAIAPGAGPDTERRPRGLPELPAGGRPVDSRRPPAEVASWLAGGARLDARPLDGAGKVYRRVAVSYEGSCHCGAIGFSYVTDMSPESWSVRACQCSFCRAHGARSTSDPGGSLRFVVSKPRELQRYRFGFHTADFLLCRNCGVYVGAVVATSRGSFGIVNLNALASEPSGLPPPAAVSYEAESRGERVRRREQRWTPLEGDVQRGRLSAAR